jgi:hypothetical protein
VPPFLVTFLLIVTCPARAEEIIEKILLRHGSTLRLNRRATSNDAFPAPSPSREKQKKRH